MRLVSTPPQRVRFPRIPAGPASPAPDLVKVSGVSGVFRMILSEAIPMSMMSDARDKQD